MATSSKREDLQGLRGIAIISVLLFHFFPKQFPNGYIGVDQFFVLSGYLISLITSGEKNFTIQFVLNFYYRRVKRIVPMYLLIILAILVSLFTIFPSSNIELNVEAAGPALLFATNVAESNNAREYYAMLSLSEDLFTHTWSLGVEMQFYLLVPLLIIGRLNISPRYSTSYFILIGICSILFSMFADGITSFNSVFARLWQFVIGIICFQITVTSYSDPDTSILLLRKENMKNEQEGTITRKDSDSAIVNFFAIFSVVMLLFGSLSPNALNKLYLRMNTTLMTASFIMCGHKLYVPKILVYLGNISFALYLVHWPIYCYVKFHYDYNGIAFALGLGIAVFLAVFLSETFEKFYLRAEKRIVASMIAFLYVTCYLILLNSSTLTNISMHRQIFVNITDKRMPEFALGGTIDVSSHTLFNVNITIDEAILLNNQYNADDIRNLNIPECLYENKGPHGNCTFQNMNTTANLSILILGNSWAANNGRLIYQHCASKASHMTLYSEAACEILVETHWPGFECEKVFNKYLDIVKKIQPDILFMITRHLSLMPKQAENETLQKDKIIKTASLRLNKYKLFVKKKIFILNAMPRPHVQLVRILNDRLASGVSVNMSELTEEANFLFTREVVATLLLECDKCEEIDYMPLFEKNGEFRMYDGATKVIFFTGGQHVSPFGLEQIRPLYRKICLSL